MYDFIIQKFNNSIKFWNCDNLLKLIKNLHIVSIEWFIRIFSDTFYPNYVHLQYLPFYLLSVCVYILRYVYIVSCVYINLLSLN